ncbi:arsenate reductase ArsC [Candidatus Margulisiibacteriota bacterium]
MAKNKLLFVCVANAARSQMAEGFARVIGGDKIEVLSAGSKPAGFVSTKANKVMQEIGIDLSRHYSKGFDDLPTKEFDYVITMGCKDTCPFYPAKETIDWEIADPKDQDIDFYRKIRDLIEVKVKLLLEGVR